MSVKMIAGISAAVGLATAGFAFAEVRASKGNLTETPDFLLILGCRVRGEEPEEILKTRICAAASYLSKNKDVIAICCGGIVHEDQTKSEAQAISEGLQKAGIEKERIILEDKSTTTEENFINAKKIIDEMKLSKDVKIAFLSSEFHLLRAAYIGKKAGLNCEYIPAQTPKAKRIGCYVRELAVFPAAILS